MCLVTYLSRYIYIYIYIYVSIINKSNIFWHYVSTIHKSSYWLYLCFLYFFQLKPKAFMQRNLIPSQLFNLGLTSSQTFASPCSSPL